MKVVEENYEVLMLPNSPTMAQIKSHKERKIRKSKAKACLFATISTTILTRIISLRTIKEVWDYLKEEYVWDKKKMRHVDVEFNKGIWVTKDRV